MSKSFLINYGWPVCYRIMPSEDRSTSTISFSIFIPFMSSSCLITTFKSLSAVLNKTREHGHPYRTPDFRGNVLDLSPSNIMFAIDNLFCSIFKDIFCIHCFGH